MVENITKIDLESKKKKDIETELIAAAKADSSAFGQLYDLYVQRLFRYLYSRLGNREEAEDLTAQTFLSAIEAFPRYRHKGYFSAWLFSIARRKMADHFRRKPKLANIELAEGLSLESGLLQQAIQSERLGALKVRIEALSENERELIRLRYVAGLSFAEMAILLKRNHEAVKKSLYRLLARLQSQMEEKND